MANLSTFALILACLVASGTEAKRIDPPSGKFQLQNPATGLCAVVLGNSDAWWAKVGTHECSCDNNYHYWKMGTLPFLKKTLVTLGRSRQCLANWERDRIHTGVTQCICDGAAIHNWRFDPTGDGDNSFQLVTEVSGKCVYAPDGGSGRQLQYDDCDKSDASQKWRFYDDCHRERYAPPTTTTTTTTTPRPAPPPPPPPRPTNIIPEYLVYFFDNGNMNWLNPTRYTLLIGGHWDSVNMIWYTVDGRQITPDSDMWTIYFGDVKPSFLSVLFPGGKSWNDVFGWMNIDFFKTWTSWNVPAPAPAPTPAPRPPPPPPRPQPTNVIPNYMVTFFNNGQIDWLTPERYSLLVGGRWDPSTLIWYTIDGRQIRPSSPEWSIYFGNLQPSDVMVFFPSGGSWNDVFGWMSPTFFQTWTRWQYVPAPRPPPQPTSMNIPIVISGYIPPPTVELFKSGRVNWLSPDRIKMLAGGQWTGSEYITRTQTRLVPGSGPWIEYFGPTDVSGVNALFGGPGNWDSNFSWLTNAVKDVPAGMAPGSFPWDSFFKQMRTQTQIIY